MSKVLALVLLLGAVAFLAPAPGADAAVLGKKSKFGSKGGSKSGSKGGSKSGSKGGSKSGVKSGSKGGSNTDRDPSVYRDDTSDCDRRRLRSRRGKKSKGPKGSKKGKKERQNKVTAVVVDDCAEGRGQITGTLTTATTTITLSTVDTDRSVSELTDIVNSYKTSLDAAFASAGDADTFVLSITIDDGSGSPLKVTFEDFESRSAGTEGRSRRQSTSEYIVTIEYFTAGTNTPLNTDVTTTIAEASESLDNFVSDTEVTETTEEETIVPVENQGTRAPGGAAAFKQSRSAGTKYVAPNYTAPTKQSAAGTIMAVGAIGIGFALAVVAVQVSRSRSRQDYETLEEDSPSFVVKLEAEIEPLVD